MSRKIGILTAGGDCPGLNAVIRGVAKASYHTMKDVEFVGIQDGFSGLINNTYKELKQENFSGILTLGGTILGTSRTPFKLMQVVEEDNVDKLQNMKDSYKKMGLDCLLVLGGNGSHKTAALLADEGLNVIGLPKTIDNDIYGTEVTFGFHSAVDIATDCIDRLHTTASSHGRCIVMEVMGNKAGWLTLYAGIAGGADVIILPEIPYDMDSIIYKVTERAQRDKPFSILAVAEGAMTSDEANMKKKDREKTRLETGNATLKIAKAIEQSTGIEARACIPGHIQRGGAPSAYDRVLSTRFGAYAAELIKKEKYGVSVALVDNIVKANPLSEIAGKSKLVP
ncbi:MAG: ATP-dependent 6-phosphofructokinase, partial [Clostridia bacterium]